MAGSESGSGESRGWQRSVVTEWHLREEDVVDEVVIETDDFGREWMVLECGHRKRADVPSLHHPYTFCYVCFI